MEALEENWIQKIQNLLDNNVCDFQVTSLKKELSDVKEIVHQKDTDLQKLKAKLEINETELNQAESALNQTMKDLNLHQDKLKKLQDEADNRVRHFEQLIARLQVFSCAKF